MGHCIQAIVAPFATANAISEIWPELPRLEHRNGFAIFPVDADLIDTRIASDTTPTETWDEFMLLTGGFRKLLRELSRYGQLAYIETDYFGGAGDQGALVCRNGDEAMPPARDRIGPVNRALKLIGMRRGWLTDHFIAAGLDRVRDNDAILALIAAQRANNA